MAECYTHDFINVPRMNVTLVNTSAPELNRLAVALHEHGELAYFVRPFANRPRKWLRPLLKVGALSRLYDSSLGRRGIENPELLQRVIEGGVVADLMMAIVRRSNLSANLKTKLEFQLYELMRAGIQKAAVNALSDVTHVLANVGTALVPFRASSGTSVKKVLHYPSAHPRYFERVWREEAKLQPEFSKTWPDF